MGCRKTVLDNARKLRGVYFIDPDDEEFKDIMKTSRRTLEVPIPAAMPGETHCGETCSVEKKCKTIRLHC